MQFARSPRDRDVIGGRGRLLPHIHDHARDRALASHVHGDVCNILFTAVASTFTMLLASVLTQQCNSVA